MDTKKEPVDNKALKQIAGNSVRPVKLTGVKMPQPIKVKFSMDNKALKQIAGNSVRPVKLTGVKMPQPIKVKFSMDNKALKQIAGNSVRPVKLTGIKMPQPIKVKFSMDNKALKQIAGNSGRTVKLTGVKMPQPIKVKFSMDNKALKQIAGNSVRPVKLTGIKMPQPIKKFIGIKSKKPIIREQPMEPVRTSVYRFNKKKPETLHLVSSTKDKIDVHKPQCIASTSQSTSNDVTVESADNSATFPNSSSGKIIVISNMNTMMTEAAYKCYVASFSNIKLKPTHGYKPFVMQYQRPTNSLQQAGQGNTPVILNYYSVREDYKYNQYLKFGSIAESDVIEISDDEDNDGESSIIDISDDEDDGEVYSAESNIIDISDD